MKQTSDKEEALHALPTLYIPVYEGTAEENHSWLSDISLHDVQTPFCRTEQMSLHALHDMEEKPILREVLAPYFAYWEQVRDLLASAWEPKNAPCSARIHAAIGHAISFQTWRSLVREQGLEDAEAIELMASMRRCL